MSDNPDQRPKPSPRPRPATARPGPRPRVAGSRRDPARPSPRPRPEEPADSTAGPTAAADTAVDAGTRGKPGTPTASLRPRGARRAGVRSSGTGRTRAAGTARRRFPAFVLVLSLLCLAAAVGAGVLLWQRLDPRTVDASILSAARDGVQAVHTYDYRESEESVQRQLAVLTGDLREQYERDLSQGGIIDTYEQVSATTSYEVFDVGLQQVNDAQDTATLVVFGQAVAESVNTGEQPAPPGSACQVTPEGAQVCVKTIQVRLMKVDGDWKISELTVLTSG
jgi:hypothetical protein